MTKQRSLYQEFYDLEGNDYRGIIKAYESNREILDSRVDFLSETDFLDHTLFLTQYIISLENQGKYSKSIEYAEKATTLIELNIKGYSVPLNDLGSYWAILATKGRCQFNLKLYDDAIGTFTNLVKRDSENDRLKQWLASSKKEKRTSIDKYIFIVALIFLCLGIFFNNLISIELDRILTKIALILILFTVINEYFYDKISEWINKK